jgi:hypothetical protein
LTTSTASDRFTKLNEWVSRVPAREEKNEFFVSSANLQVTVRMQLTGEKRAPFVMARRDGSSLGRFYLRAEKRLFHVNFKVDLLMCLIIFPQY